MGQRKPLYNAELQNDLDGKGFNIDNLNQLDVVQSGTIYVDSGLATEIGKIDSFMAFKTLAAALNSAPAGYTVIMRPGSYAYDGLLDVERQHIKIFGAGAIIVPATAGGTAGLSITANFVQIDGLSFDGAASGTPTNTGTVIELNHAQNVTLSNLIIQDQQGDGITLVDRYSSVVIDSCNISDCYRGIVGGIASSNDITSIRISGSLIQDCRSGGIVIHGNDNVDRVRDIKIVNNDISNCDRSGTNSAAIDVSAGCSDIVIAHNYLTRCFYGIYSSLSSRISIDSNSIFGMNGTLIHNDGNQDVTISGNLLDGSNPNTGNPQALVGIAMVGFFTVAGNDAGPYSISGNMMSGIQNGQKFINTANANDILIEGNQFTGSAVVLALSFNNLKISDNQFNITGSVSVIKLDADTRGWVNCTISDNRFKLAQSNGWSRLIATNDTLATGQTNLTVVGNWSTPFITFSSGILDNIDGADPTNMFLHSNTPQATEWDRSGGVPDRRKGWVNDYQKNLVSDRINIPTDSSYKYQVGGSQVVGSRITGWTLPTGTQTRTTFDPATVTLAQLGQRVNALIHDLHITTGHGLIGFYS